MMDWRFLRVLDDRLMSYLYYFNIKADYFECHEYGESLWLDSGRPVVLKGLIQAAVCLYHVEGGNIRGGLRMWTRAKSYLSDELPIYQGIDLTSLITDVDTVFHSIPKELHTQVVPVKRVKALHLPAVKIRITDASMVERLKTWNPAPLQD
jgi:hypothetical protein